MRVNYRVGVILIVFAQPQVKLCQECFVLSHDRFIALETHVVNNMENMLKKIAFSL